MESEVVEEGIEIDKLDEDDFTISPTGSVADELEDLQIQGEEDEVLNVSAPETANEDEAIFESTSSSQLGTSTVDLGNLELVDDVCKDIDTVAFDDHDGIQKLVNIKIEPKEPECQFFGSFYNEKQLKEPSIDLVTFSASCRITEIRVIPLGATAEMLDGVALLGSTNPTHFDLEFYYEDLTDPGSATFKAIEQFTYDDKLSIQLLCGSDEDPIITNKILVRGLYSSVTLAILGYEIENFPVRIPSPEPEVIPEDLAYSTSPDSQPGRGSSEEEGEADLSPFFDDGTDERSEEEEEVEIKTELSRVDYSSHSDSEINDDVEMIDTFDSYNDDYTTEETPTYEDTPWENFEQTDTPSPPPDDHEHEQEERDDELETEQDTVIDEENFETEEKAESFCSEDSYIQGELDDEDQDRRSNTEADMIETVTREYRDHEDDDILESEFRSTSSSPVLPEAPTSVVTEVTHNLTPLIFEDESASQHFVHTEVTQPTIVQEILCPISPEIRNPPSPGTNPISPETSNLVSPESSIPVSPESSNPASPESSSPVSQEISNDLIDVEISNANVPEVSHSPVTPENSNPNAPEAEVIHPAKAGQEEEMAILNRPEASRLLATPDVMANVSPVIPPLLDTEDISDGDISSVEDEDNEPNVDNEQSTASSMPLSVSTPPLTPVVEEDKPKAALEKDSEKQNETMSDQDQFEYDFEYDLEVISDDEINDYPESEQASEMEDDEELPLIFGRPYDIEAFKFHRPQNYWIDLYPRIYLNNDSLLKEKLREALNQYSPEAFKLKMQILESWVEAMEEVLPVIIPFLNSVPTNKLQSSTDTLCFWVQECFQPPPSTSSDSVSVTVNLRQLKLGLKLVFCLCEFDNILTNEVCALTLYAQKTMIQRKLVEILVESRSPVVQYLSIQALESTINTLAGFKRLTEPETPNEDNLLTKLVIEHMNMKLSRFVASSLESFFEKVNFIKRVMNISELARSSTILDDPNVMIKLHDDLSWILETFENFDMNLINLKSSSSDAALAIIMSKHLPASYDPKVNRVKLLKEVNFIDACSKLMIRFNSNYKLMNLLVAIFQCLLKWEVGIVYLAEDFTLELLRILSQTDLCQPNGLTFATYFTQCMTVMKCVDQCPKNMRNLSVKQGDAVIDALHEVYLLLAYESGRKAITHIFTTGNFIERLLDCVKFAEIVAAETDKIKEFEKTAIGGYSVDLLVHVIRTADKLNFLEDHGAEIDRLFKSLRETFEGYDKLKEVMPYMEPTLHPTNFMVGKVTELCDALKAKTEFFLKSEVNWGFTPEIITILRIVDGLQTSRSIRSCSTVNGEGGAVGEVFRVKVVTVNLNSADILTTLMGILTRLIEEYKQPAMHAHEFLHGKGEALVSLVLPAIRIIRNLLTRLIKIQNTNFRDLTFLPVLLPLYALLSAFPEKSYNAKDANKIHMHIIACLQTFTIPVIQLGEQSEETLMNSIWTKMVSEIITFTMTSPCNFIPGMTILSEMQPLNLPIVSTEELPESVKVQLVSLRRLWSAFLHGVTLQFQEMIGILCESTNRELVTLVRRVCLQVADLSAASCLMTCRGIMEPIVASMESDLEEKATNSELPSSVTAWVEVSHDRLNVQCSPRTARLLGFLSSLMKRSGVIKAGVMHVMRVSSKVDEKFSEFMTMLGCILTSSHRKASAAHVKGQDHVMSIFQSLCSLKINMFNSTLRSITESKLDFDYVRSNSLPQKDTLTLICSSLLTFLGLQDNILGNVAVIRKIFFGLNVLSVSEYGFYHLRLALCKNPTVVHDLIVRLKTNNLENLDIVGVMESLEVIDSVLRFLRNLITPHSATSGTPEPRKSILSKIEFRKLLGWSSPETALNHPLLQLCTYLRACVASDNSQGPEGGEEQQYLKTYMAEAKEKLDKVLSFVHESSSVEGHIMSEVVMNAPDSLHDQFARRPVIVPYEIIDHYEKMEHLNLITQDPDVNFEFSTDDLILCNLLETTKDCMTVDSTEAEFLADLEKFCNLRQEEEEPTTNEKHETTYGDIHARPNYFDLLNNLQGTPAAVQAKLSFMRGISSGRLGFGRGLITRPGFDPFRSRPPNTSRPPSLHVDDFVAMESSSQGSSTSNRGRNVNEGFRGRGIRGTPSPLTRNFNQDRGRGYCSGSSGSPFYSPQSDPASARGRSPLRGRGFSSGNERWPPSLGGGDNSGGSPGRNYGGGRQDDGPSLNYDRSAGRHYGGRGGGYRDMPGRPSTPGGSNQLMLHQQQRWRNKPNQFNR